jgi:hypothetical protein
MVALTQWARHCTEAIASPEHGSADNSLFLHKVRLAASEAAQITGKFRAPNNWQTRHLFFIE